MGSSCSIYNPGQLYKKQNWFGKILFAVLVILLLIGIMAAIRMLWEHGKQTGHKEATANADTSAAGGDLLTETV